MAWEPRADTKIAVLLAAMEADRLTHPIWSQTEAGKAMDVPRSMVPNYVAAACNAERLFRRTLVNGSGIELSLQRFPAQAPAPLSIPSFSKTAARDAAAAVGEQSENARATGYVPPKMVAPRPGSDVALPKQSPGTPPAPAHTSAPIPSGVSVPPPPAQTPASAPAPAPTPAPLPTAAAQEEPSPEGAEEETVEPNAFVDIGSGDVILVGCEVDEDGRVTVPSELVRKIVGRMAWSPLR